jgi:hypothetical protein
LSVKFLIETSAPSVSWCAASDIFDCTCLLSLP